MGPLPKFDPRADVGVTGVILTIQRDGTNTPASSHRAKNVSART